MEGRSRIGVIALLVPGVAVLVFVLIFALPASGRGGALYNSGDVLVADSSNERVVAVNPDTGVISVVGSGTFFRFPSDVVVDENGDLLVVDRDAFVGPGAIIRVDAATGAQTPVSANQISSDAGGKELFDDPIALDRKGGSLFVADFGGKQKRVIKVDIATGKQSLVTKGKNLGGPFGIDVEGKDLLVADAGGRRSNLGTRGGVVEVNAKSGKQKVISSAGDFDGPSDVVAEDKDSALVIDPGSYNFTGALFRVNLKTGAQKTIFKKGDVSNPNGVALAGRNEAYVSGALRPNVTNGQLFSVNLKTGKQTLIQGSGFNNPLGITVAP